MSNLMPFQQATVVHAVKRLTARGSKRFLVADEVGLGKTFVAKEIVRQLVARGLVRKVFYICSSRQISAQNGERLKSGSTAGAVEFELAREDRITLLPISGRRAKGAIQLFSFSPNTSFPDIKGRYGTGRKEERARVYALLEETCPNFLDKFEPDFFARPLISSWEVQVSEARYELASVPNTFKQTFLRMVRAEFSIARNLASWTPDEVSNAKVYSRLRRALASTILRRTPPDLIILDEFQKFRNFISAANDGTDPLIAQLFEGTGSKAPMVLLLSATPYRLYAQRWEEEGSEAAHGNFLEVVGFVTGGTKAKVQEEVGTELANLGHALRGISRVGQHDEKLPGLLGDARSAKQRLEELLRRHIARTERRSQSDDELPHSRFLETLRAGDIKVYRHFVDSLSEKHRSYALPYWDSVPLPLQGLGKRYKITRGAKRVAKVNGVELTTAHRDTLSPPNPWPSPKLRLLAKVLDDDLLKLPWVPPSKPWWTLSGAWRGTEGKDPKALLFGRFRAVPPVVSGLMNLSLAATVMPRGAGAYQRYANSELLRLKAGQVSLLALFHPSPFLVRCVDPLMMRGLSPARRRNRARQQIRKALRELPGGSISIDRKSTRHRPYWEIIKSVEAAAGTWDVCRDAWRSLFGSSSQGEDTVRKWDAVEERSSISEREFSDLVEMALGGPGIILARAAFRHWPEALRFLGTGKKPYLRGDREQDPLNELISTSWNRLRTYLGKPIFKMALMRGKEPFTDRLRASCEEGNLESVLDEHFWAISAHASGPGILKSLQESLSLHAGNIKIPQLLGGSPISIHCHAFLPFAPLNNASAGGTIFREDTLRVAFNSPFWPYLLATTSVGQEGLDFHVWCRRVIHWDLCANPVDFEQREGRVERFGGLSVRRAIADRLKGEAELDAVPLHGSLWKRIEALMRDQFTNTEDGGLTPWWVIGGGGIDRRVLGMEMSEISDRLQWLKEQRLLYRLVLGQPDQHDLVERLGELPADVRERLRDLTINLAPYSFGT